MGRMSEEWAEQQSRDQVLDAEYSEWLSSLADMEWERQGCPMLQGGPTLDEEPIERPPRNPHTKGTIQLPEQQAQMRQLERGLKADIKRWRHGKDKRPK